MASQDLIKISAQTKKWISTAINDSKCAVGLELPPNRHYVSTTLSDNFSRPEWTKLRIFSWKILGIVHLNTVLSLAHSAWTLYRAVQAWKNLGVPDYEKVISVYLATWWWFQGMLALSFFSCKQDLVDFTPKMLKYLEENSAALTETSNKKWLVWLHWCVCASAKYCPRNFQLMLTAWALWEPYSPTLLGSLLEDPQHQGSPPVLHRLLSSAVVSYQQWNFALMVNLALLTIGAGLLNVLLLDSRMRNSVFTKSAVLQKSIRYFNQVHLVLRLFNNAFAPLMLPAAQVFLLLSCTFGFYGLIRFSGFIRLGTGVAGLYSYWCLILIFKMPAAFHVQSQRYLADWNRVAEGDGLERRIHRSAREWRIVCGSYCFIDGELILTISEMIMGHVTNLLLLNI